MNAEKTITIRFSVHLKNEMEIATENEDHFTTPAEQECVKALSEMLKVGDEYEVTLSTEALRVFIDEARTRLDIAVELYDSEDHSNYPVYSQKSAKDDLDALRYDYRQAVRAYKDAQQALGESD